MSCGHWKGALSPCPACACGEKVGAGLPRWLDGPPEMPWSRETNDVITAIWDWEADWRGRLEACSEIEWYAGDDRWQTCEWCDWSELRAAAEKLRRMRE